MELTTEAPTGEVNEGTTKEKKESTVIRTRFDEVYAKESPIKIVVEANPKKLGSKARARFEFYYTASTVAEYLEQGGTYQDIAYDVGHNFITVG